MFLRKFKKYFKKNYFSFFLEFIILALVYYCTARIGLALEPVGGFATLVWPPTGIALAAIYLRGYRFLPAITLAAFLVNFNLGAPFLVALGISIGNTLEAFAAVYLLRKFQFRPTFDRLADVIRFIALAGLISTLISSSIGTTTLFLGNIDSAAKVFPTWLAWWIGDMLGCLTFAPFILIWTSKTYLRYTRFKVVELISALILLLGLSLIIFSGSFKEITLNAPITYLIFPPLIWLALRFGQKEITFSNLLLSVLAIIFTSLGLGPFIIDSLSGNLFNLQIYMAIVTSTSLIMTAIVTERNHLALRKDEFISLASHELKTPITVISGLNQLMIKHSSNNNKTKTLAYLRSSSQQISKLTKLINNLLDISRIQMGKFDINKAKFRLNELLKETVVNLNTILKTKQIILQGGNGIVIMGDKDGIGEVLQNLITNAIKYSPPKSRVTVNVITNHSQFVTISISDHGIGIPAEFKDKIFDRFYRISDSKSSGVSGLGLGLYLSANIIKQHGGRIWFTSKHNKGTTFFFTLPLDD